MHVCAHKDLYGLAISLTLTFPSLSFTAHQPHWASLLFLKHAEHTSTPGPWYSPFPILLLVLLHLGPHVTSQLLSLTLVI